MADPDVISEESFDSHVKEKLIPYVQGLYRNSEKIQATMDQLVTDLVTAVEKTNSRDKVCFKITIKMGKIGCNLIGL